MGDVAKRTLMSVAASAAALFCDSFIRIFWRRASANDSIRKRVLAARFDCDGLSVSYRPLQGDNVTFDWTGPLLVNGEARPLHNANHYEGPNCVTDGWPATQMVVVHGDQAIQLDFAGG